MKSIQRTRKVLIGARWFLITGLVFYSLMTTTPFVSEHSEWAWSGFALGLIVDAAFIMSLQADSTLATLGVRLSGWPVAFRWFTGLASVFLNIWVSVARGDYVGVAVHLIAPALVMLLAEVGPVYLAALAEAEAKQAEPPKPTEWLANEPEEPQTAAQALPLTGADPIPARFLNEPQAPAEGLPESPGPIAEDVAQHAAKLSNKEANNIIHEGWRHKLPVTEVAAAASRHPSTVRRKFKEFEDALNA